MVSQISKQTMLWAGHKSAQTGRTDGEQTVVPIYPPELCSRGDNKQA